MLSGVRKVGIVITDGRSDDPDDTWAQAMVLRNNNNVSMVAVGIGDNIRKLELEGIASAPHSTSVMLVDNYEDLTDEIQENLVHAVCNSE